MRPGEYIRTAMENKRWNSSYLGLQAKINRATIDKIIKEDRDPRLVGTMLPLCKALGLDPKLSDFSEEGQEAIVIEERESTIKEIEEVLRRHPDLDMEVINITIGTLKQRMIFNRRRRRQKDPPVTHRRERRWAGG